MSSKFDPVFPFWEALMNDFIVIPAHAGIQSLQCTGCRPSPAWRI